MVSNRIRVLLSVATVILGGCHRPYANAMLTAFCQHDRQPYITAMPASPQNSMEPAGIPFYLPKPLLVISKNFYHIEESKVGLTKSAVIPDGFDNQASYADLNARTNFDSPGGNDENPGKEYTSSYSDPVLHSATPIPVAPDSLPSDGLAPHVFFTYEIVFVPDLTQKYVMQVHGGAGEIRAAMNLVNGWMFTGLGPYYMKDSSTSQNILSRGIAANLAASGAADVIDSVANLVPNAPSNVDQGSPTEAVNAIARLAKQVANHSEVVNWNEWSEGHFHPETGELVIPRIHNYAEIYVYEAALGDNGMEWRPVANHCFDRELLGKLKSCAPTTSLLDQVPKREQIEGILPAPKTQSASEVPSIQLSPEAVQGAMESFFMRPQPDKKSCLPGLNRSVHASQVLNLPVPVQQPSTVR